MILHKFKDITAGAGAEVVETILSGTATPTKRLISLIPEQTAEVRLRVYIDKVQVIDVPSNMIGASANPRIPVDRVLAEGEQVSVGWLNETAGAVTKFIVAEYEE